MVGDGITDLEAVQATGGADLFIGAETTACPAPAPACPPACSLPACLLTALPPLVVILCPCASLCLTRTTARLPCSLPSPAAPAAGFGGVVARPLVRQAADWWVTSFDALREALPRYRVAMIGSGGRADGWEGVSSTHGPSLGQEIASGDL